MTDFIIKKLPYNLTSNAGLALVGQYLKTLNFSKRIDAAFPLGAKGIANSDVLKSYLGLLVQGKNDFDAIEAHRGDDFFARALGVGCVPSSPTLRQRMDTHAASWFTLAGELNLALLSGKYADARVDFGALPCGYMPVDWDTFVMDNSKTRKQDVGRTYQGVDGYTPSATYIGTLGYCLELALRPGVQHSALETDYNLQRVLPMAAQLCDAPLLFRADSGLCSQAIFQEIGAQAQALQRQIAFIIKWNPRRAAVETWAQQRRDDSSTQWIALREGKRECYWHDSVVLKGQDEGKGVGQAQDTQTPCSAIKRIYRLTERSIDKHGQPLLLPQYELEGWTTNLPERFSMLEVVSLYCEHATHEQFHSEFKTDMDLERLPSGRFDTNYLVCALASVALNILRLIGQNALTGKDAPIRHSAKRRRIKTVMQELMFKAARMIKHAGRWALGLGANDGGFAVFERHYGQMKTA